MKLVYKGYDMVGCVIVCVFVCSLSERNMRSISSDIEGLYREASRNGESVGGGGPLSVEYLLG